jgi:hypothetical protein
MKRLPLALMLTVVGLACAWIYFSRQPEPSSTMAEAVVRHPLIKIRQQVLEKDVKFTAEIFNASKLPLFLDGRALEMRRFVVIKFKEIFVGNLPSHPGKFDKANIIEVKPQGTFAAEFLLRDVFPRVEITDFLSQNPNATHLECEVFCEYDIDPFVAFFPEDKSNLADVVWLQKIKSNVLKVSLPVR